MTASFMRAVDKYAGYVLCRLSSMFYRRKGLPRDVKSVVIIKMFGMGSIILMTPMIRALREKYTGVEISFVTFSQNSEIPAIYGIAHSVYPIRRDSLLNFILDTCRTVLCLRKKRQSVVIDAEFFSKFTALLSLSLRADYRIGFYNRNIYKGDLIDFRTYFSPYKHITEIFMELLAPLSCRTLSRELAPPCVSDEARKKITGRFSSDGIGPGSHIVLINPNVSDVSSEIDRCWPEENFIEVARSMVKRGFHVVMIGDSEQEARTDDIAVRCGPGTVSWAGKLSIHELLALTERAFLMVTNDSGPLHMAVSAGLPTVSFFGTESPLIYGHDHGVHKVFYSGLQCSPCLSVFNYKRGSCEFDYRCMRSIRAEDVISYIDRRMGEFKSYHEERVRGRA